MSSRTIIDYHAPFDRGLTRLHRAQKAFLYTVLSSKSETGKLNEEDRAHNDFRLSSWLLDGQLPIIAYP